jgi:hypothetical protein
MCILLECVLVCVDCISSTSDTMNVTVDVLNKVISDESSGQYFEK